MNYSIIPLYKNIETKIVSIINEFNTSGLVFDNGNRNKIKIFEIDNQSINVKSFKNPHLINKFAYRYIRKSKARRSFEYANILLEKGIGTPQPIAYFENYDFIGIKDSYYVCEHLNCDFTFRELVENPDFPDHEKILRQFTRFSFDLHQKGIEFLDHSPGNTLIKKNEDGNYDFYLVDLNRMKFHKTMTFEIRMKNLCRLTKVKEMVVVMSNEYAKWYPQYSELQMFDKIWGYINEFQRKLVKKMQLKKKLKFYKN